MKDNPTPKKKLWRRTIGIIVVIFLILLPIACVLSPINLFPRIQKSGLWLVLIALAIGCVNFYLSFIRPLLHRMLKRNMNTYRFISGFPGGTILQIAGVIVGFGSLKIGLIGLLVVIINTGGVLWFVIWTWKDKSFWDR